MRVLVLDAERLIAQPLRRAGHTVTEALSCAEALALAQRGAYDAIVLETVPSEWESLAACGELRRCGVLAPILLIVGQDTAEGRVEGLDAGADDCVSVSCEFPELLARLRALVRRAHAGDAVLRGVRGLGVTSPGT